MTGHVSGRRDQEDALTQRRLAADRLVLEVAGNELGKRAVALSIGLELVSLGGHRPWQFATRPTSSSAAPTAPSASTRGLCTGR